MGDEASGGSDSLPWTLTRGCAGAVVDPDDTTSHTPSQPQPHNSDRPCLQASAHLVPLHAMADRDRRSRVERACSNIPAVPSRSSTQQHRRNDDQAASNGAVPEARNRHRDRNIPNSGRHRSTAGGSANQRASAELELMEDYTDDTTYVSADNVNVAVTSDLTLLPVVHADFVQVLPSSVSSAENWQACYYILFMNYIIYTTLHSMQWIYYIHNTFD